jgi:hypothetical protein
MGKRRIKRHFECDWISGHMKVKDIKTIEELPKLTKKPLAKERNEMVKKKKNVEQEINSMGARVLANVGCASFD